MRRFAHEAAEVVSNTDSRLLRSLRGLLQPGHLTAEYFAGRRRPYLRPLQIFLICNLLFFILQPVLNLNVFTTTFYNQLRSMPYSGLAREMVAARVTEGTEEYDRFGERFDALTQDHARTMVIVMTPMFAAVLALMYARRRLHFARHLVFSIHFFSYVLLVVVAVFSVLVLTFLGGIAIGVPERTVQQLSNSDALFGVLALTACVWWLAKGVRVAYGNSWPVAILMGFVLSVGLFTVLHAYRFVLFMTVMALIGS